ncbi:MAG TPA: VOC family protein [Candidatus Acidoferrum sp.]|nr:VOC family protein [Candidatus Acidoferrum sp.]
MAKPRKAARGRSSNRIEFNHAMVYVRDLTPALKFYVDQLGFKTVEVYEHAYARLRSPKGSTSIALHVAPPHEQVSAEGVRLYFEVKELDDVCARLQVAGVQLTQPPKIMPWGWRHAYLNDPDGHEISLYWAGKKRFQKTVMKRSAGA